MPHYIATSICLFLVEVGRRYFPVPLSSPALFPALPFDESAYIGHRSRQSASDITHMLEDDAQAHVKLVLRACQYIQQQKRLSG